MKFGVVLALLALLFLTLAFRYPVAAIPFAWCGVACGVVSSGYLGVGPRIVGKRRDGSMPVLRGVLLFPYLVYTWTIWGLYCLVVDETVCDEVAPSIWLGRRPRPRELPHGMRVVVDLTAEFPASTAIVASGVYRSLPALDGASPAREPYLALVAELAAIDGPIYIHCAFGHGRSAAVAAGVLIARGLARDVDDAERILRAARPRVSMSASQRRLVGHVVAPPVPSLAAAVA